MKTIKSLLFAVLLGAAFSASALEVTWAKYTDTSLDSTVLEIPGIPSVQNPIAPCRFMSGGQYLHGYFQITGIISGDKRTCMAKTRDGQDAKFQNPLFEYIVKPTDAKLSLYSLGGLSEIPSGSVKTGTGSSRVYSCVANIGGQNAIGYIMADPSSPSSNICRTVKGDSSAAKVLLLLTTTPSASMYPSQWRSLSEGATTHKWCYVKETGLPVLFGLMVSSTECGVIQAKTSGYELVPTAATTTKKIEVPVNTPTSTAPNLEEKPSSDLYLVESAASVYLADGLVLMGTINGSSAYQCKDRATRESEGLLLNGTCYFLSSSSTLTSGGISTRKLMVLFTDPTP